MNRDEIDKLIIEAIKTDVSSTEVDEINPYTIQEYLCGTIGGYSITEEDSYGGEGMGDEYWFVLCIEKGTEKIYIRFLGFYDSWNGVEWDYGYTFVEPREVKRIEWVDNVV